VVIDLKVPDMNESIYAQICHELWRFPYLPDKSRNVQYVEELATFLFNHPGNVAIEYPGGYLVLYDIKKGDEATAFWIHFEGQKVSHKHLRAAVMLMRGAMDKLELKSIQIDTADENVVRMCQKIGFEIEWMRDDFMWHGNPLKRYHLRMGRNK